ncbi:unnamed protein product [Brachionus calyciflorus]|uniref:Mannosyltransferase n=1 Tax=Brachionus calyciflorus TaxID=104777 RepID=A0A814ADH6_9BILA|nr:unnamed protein product [Brachionus calyciflorus]
MSNFLKKYFDEYLSYKNLLIGFTIYRLLNIFLNQTWFVPDEFWQSQEIAHKLAFDYGYLTWEWKVGIRSYVYPFFLAIFYKAIQIVHLDKTDILIYISPILHCLLTAFSDFLFLLYVKKFFNKKIAYLSSICRLISWYSIYSSPRSISNNLEEFFTILSLYSFEDDTVSPRYSKFNIAGFFSFILRPTSAINLIPLYVYQFFFLCNRIDLKKKFIINFVLIGVLILSFGVLIDSYFYGSFLISWWNFFLYNVYNNIGIHYGTHSFHWYFTQGYPTLIFIHIVLFIFGLKYSNHLKFQLVTIFFNMVFYSLLSHKEFRFLTQIMPFTMIICAYGIENLKNLMGKKLTITIFVVVGVGNIVLAIFLGILHQRGPISLMYYLRSIDLEEGKDSILFLTPCHSTPYYSYLHKNVSMRFLTCEPNLKNLNNYIDEADVFFNDPPQWLLKNQEVYNDVTYVVMFENLYENIGSKFDNFKICKRFFYSLIQQTERTDKTLLLLCSKSKNLEEDKSYDSKIKFDLIGESRGYNLRRYDQILIREKVINCNPRFNFFTNTIVNVLNQLPKEVMEAKNLNSFKAKLDPWLLNNIEATAIAL